MNRILVVDDMAIFREPIAASLRRVGYETVCASNGQEALDAIHTKAPDLVLLDLAMPVMDGLTCLRTLRSNPDTKALPVIMLTAMTEREPLKEAVGIGVQGYLLKSQFSLEDLITRVKKVLAQAKGAPAQSSTRERPSARASSTDRGASGRTPEAKDSSPPDPMTESQTLAQIRREAQIRAVPTVLQHVMALTTNNRTSFDEVGAAVRRDHALALKVMKVANSSFFGAGKTAQTLSEAAHRIGMSGVRNTIATIMTIEHFHASALGGLTPQRFWEHSLATGAISDLLGQALGAEDAENLFLAGLLHDIGRLVLSTVFPDHYRAVMEAGAERGINLIPIEKEVFGIAHHEVTREVLTQWETPVEVRDPAWAHELPVTEIRRTVKNSRSALIVSLADRLAHA
ncbi:MAG: HDOD domain-containing protein, partial [Dehalococcoidia bacterium]